MRKLKDILQEADTLAQEKAQEKKAVFIETDPQTAFPDDTMSAIEKEITKGAKDLEQDWKSAVELVDFAFDELDVPKPQAFLKERWEQYKKLIKQAVSSLKSARGMKGNWKTSI